MTTREKIEGYMVKLSLTFDSVNDATWVIRDEEKGLDNVVVMLADPLVVIRVKVMETPAEDQCTFFEELLKLNASDLVHGAYALDDASVVLIDTLEAATMDLEEFQASLDAIGLALVQHYKVLARYRVQKA